MTGPELVADLCARGVRLTAHGGRLLYDAPVGAMTPELAGQVKAHKADLLAVLADVPEPPAERTGYMTELVLRKGRFHWRRRRMDEADRAWAAYHAATSDE